MARTLSSNVSAGIAGDSAPVWLLEVDSDSSTFRWATANCNATAVPAWTGNTFDGSRLAEGGLGDVTVKVDLARGGNRAELSGFSFRLLNSDLYSDTLASHKFSGRRVELRIVFIDKALPSWGNAAPVWSGFITEPPNWDAQYIYFNASPSWVSRHKTLPPRVMTREQFPNLPDENEGRRVPIVLGDWRLGLGENRSGIASNRSPGASEVIHRDYFPGFLDRPFQKSGNQPTYNPRAVFADHYLRDFPVPFQEGTKFLYSEERKVWTQARVKANTFGGTGDHFRGIVAMSCFPTTSLDITEECHLVPVVDDVNSANVTSLSNAVDTDDSNYTELNGAADVAAYEVPNLYGGGRVGNLVLRFWITRTGFVDDKVQYRVTKDGYATVGWSDLPTYGSLGGVTLGTAGAPAFGSDEGLYNGLRVEFRYQQVGGFDGASFKIYSVYFEVLEKNGSARAAVHETGSGLIYERWIDSASHTTAKNAGDLIENPAAAVEALLAHYCDINPLNTNGALVFDGGDHLELETSESLESVASAFTLAAWVYITESPISTPHVIIRKCNALAGATAGPYDFYINSSGRLVLAVGDGASEVATTGATALSPNTWYFVAGTWDGTTARVYVNGVNDASTVAGLALADSGASGSIGGNSDLANSGLTGRIDELQAWNYARSAATLLAETSAKTYHTTGEEGLVLLCHFDEGDGDHFRDSSGLFNDPKHTGGTTTPTSWADGTVNTPEGINSGAFDDVHSNRALWRLATVLGVSAEAKLSLEIIKDVCNEFSLGYLQDAAGREKVSRIEAVGSPSTIGSSHILTEGTKTSARVGRGKITDLRNEFYFHFKRNASSLEYEELLFCINPQAGVFSSSFCNFATDAEAYWDKCRAAGRE
ncbi:MAG: LamG domain-containing protein [Candidatus Eisenbacteria bacterium]|nr:LamG domain-containing protein [Candidatus Eisenbacteria bacterium]